MKNNEGGTDHRTPDTVPGARKKRPRVVRKGTEREVITGLPGDEQDSNWAGSGSGPAPSSRDAEFLANVPPHWRRT